MPYSASDPSSLPDYVQKLSAKRRRQWVDVWHSAYQRCQKSGGKDCESSAFAQANGVVGAKVQLSVTEPGPAVSVATFALDLEPYDAGDIVYRPGLLFRAGDYPDKDFSMSVEELRAAVDAFGEAKPVDLEHIPTPLSGKLGEVVHVEASDDGQELHGIVALPKWLDGVLDERKVSATWNRTTKQLEGLALVLNPRVNEAALMAAFSAAGGSMAVDMSKLTQEQRDKLPEADFGDPKRRLYPIVDQDDVDSAASLIGKAHDPDAVKTRIIAIAKRKKLSIPEAWQSDSANHSDVLPGEVGEALAAVVFARHDTPQGQMVMQELHNVSARYGAVCKSSNATMASAHESAAIQKVHDLTTEHGAKCASVKNGSSYPMFSRKEGSPVSNAWDWLKSKLEGEPAPEETGTAAGTATMSSAQNAEFESLKKRQAELEAENRRIHSERIHDQAVVFADTQIREKRAFPAEREAIVSQYIQAATDDMLHGTVTFGEGKVTNRVQMLTETFSARKAHAFDTESLDPQTLALLSNRSETDRADKLADEKRVKELAEMTPLGRATFTKKNGTN